MAYAVTKAAQVQLMKCLAQTQGPKVRINAVLPGLLLTEWVRRADRLRAACAVQFPADPLLRAANTRLSTYRRCRTMRCSSTRRIYRIAPTPL